MMRKEQVRQSAVCEVTEKRSRHVSEPGIPVLGQPAKYRLPYLLSKESPRRLNRHYRWAAKQVVNPVFLCGNPRGVDGGRATSLIGVGAALLLS